MRLPSLSTLRCIEAVARLGSVTKAAAELHLTQSAVSHQLSEGERLLGVNLFERQRGRLVSMPACQQLSKDIAQSIQDLSNAVRQVQKEIQVDPKLTLSMLPSVATKWLVPRLASFIEDNPDIELSIRASRGFTDFTRERVDAAIRYGRGRWTGVEARLLAGETVLPVCSPQYASEVGLRQPDDLARAMLLHNDIDENWDMWHRHFGTGRLAPKGNLHFTEDSALIEGAVAGLGVALGRSILVYDDLASGRLVAPFSQRLETQFRYWFVWPSKAPDKPSRSLMLSWLQEHFARC